MKLPGLPQLLPKKEQTISPECRQQTFLQDVSSPGQDDSWEGGASTVPTGQCSVEGSA